MAKLLIMSGVDISEQGLILVTDEGLISSFPHTGGKKIREVWGDGGKRR